MSKLRWERACQVSEVGEANSRHRSALPRGTSYPRPAPQDERRRVCAAVFLGVGTITAPRRDVALHAASRLAVEDSAEHTSRAQSTRRHPASGTTRWPKVKQQRKLQADARCGRRGAWEDMQGSSRGTEFATQGLTVHMAPTATRSRYAMVSCRARSAQWLAAYQGATRRRGRQHLNAPWHYAQLECDGSVWRTEAAAYIQAQQLTAHSNQQDGSWCSRSRTCNWCVRVPISSGGVHLVAAAHSPRQVA